MKFKEVLNDEVLTELESLKEMEVGSDERGDAMDDLIRLMDRAIEIEKMEIDRDTDIATREIENNLKRKSMEDERIDKVVKNALTAASIVTGVGLTVWGTLKSLKFEEEGTVTTIVGRGFINKLLPKK